MTGSTFLSDSGRLRSGWRFAIFAVVYPLFWIVASLALYLIFLRPKTPYFFLLDLGVDAELGLNILARFIAVVAALLFVARFIERKPASGFIGFNGWPRNMAIGLAVGMGMVLLLLAALALLGNTHLRWAPAGMIPFVFGTATIIVGAAHEELLFRGYSMQTLAEGMGASGAAALMSALFGLLHLGNPHASAIGIMNTIVAGLMLSAAFFKVRSLWLPFGIHAAWNVGLGIVLGFSLSGLDLDSLWKATADGSPILTGGFYGPEGGILCTMVFLAGLGVLWRVRAQNKYLKR